ncbi:YdcF family protein [Paraburkholderia fungorum]|uniref:YdcF family protein n=1 Tax=Paraburkholderia fungorum TaxID=134537 RepID=UPI0038BC9AB3
MTPRNPTSPTRAAFFSLMLGVLWVIGSGVWSIASGPTTAYKAPVFGERNAIVLLSAGAERSGPHSPFLPTYEAISRIQKAAAAYMICKEGRRVCIVIVSGGDPDNHGIADAVVYQSQLKSLGVSAVDLVLEKNSRTTYENAKYVEPLLRGGHYDSVVLVTSSYHMRRATFAFNRLGIDVMPDAAWSNAAVLSLLPRTSNFRVAWRGLHEIAGIVQLRAYNWASF